jgi:hypothetical protein
VSARKTTEPQDRPSTARRTLLTGGVAGLAAVAGATLGRAEPASAATQNVIQLLPSTDTSGGMDTANIKNALAALANGGVVWLAPGQFYVKGSATTPAITIPEQTTSGVAGGSPCSLMGSGAATVLNLVGPASTAIFAHRTSNYNPQFGIPAQHTMGFIRDLVIDGTSAAAGSVGLDAGSGWGLDVNVTIVNFTASGCVAFNQFNRNNWTEKCRFRLSLMNNATAAVIGAQAGSALSHDYNEFDFYIFTNDGQNGIVIQDGSHLGGPFFRLHGNVGNWTTSAAGNAALTVGSPGKDDGSAITYALFHVNVEFDTGTGGSFQPATILFSGPSNVITESSGQMRFNGGANSNAAPGAFQFKGLVSGDPVLTGSTFSQPAVPSSTHSVPNNGPVPAMVYITGGQVSAVKINGVATGLTSGAFYLPLTATITLVYTTGNPPTWVWVPCSASE